MTIYAIRVCSLADRHIVYCNNEVLARHNGQQDPYQLAKQAAIVKVGCDVVQTSYNSPVTTWDGWKECAYWFGAPV